MNRAFYIILIPAVLVALGYVVVFRLMGETPEYWRAIVPLAALGGALLWFARRSARKESSSAQR